MPSDDAARVLPTERRVPTRPGFYWARWQKAAPGTHEGDELTPSQDWEVVEVWVNHIGPECEADKENGIEKFGVSVPGVQQSQWLENFRWGERVEPCKKYGE